ncbi:MAG: LytR/AlgR family response regulator transcription factor [Candidatus Fimivivens sp.]
MFRIAICDDDRKLSSQLETMILDHYDSSGMEIDVFDCGEHLCRSLKNDKIYDLVFLDIELLGIDGVETGLKIRNDLCNDITQIVYISWNESYYKLLFEVRPNNFLLKPVEQENVIYEIEKAKKLSDKFNKAFIYKKSYDTFKVFIKDILYFESKNKKIRIVTANGEDFFYDRLENVMEALEGLTFYRIHKSYYVNLSHVLAFKYEELQMTNGEILAISQSKRKEVRAKQLAFFEGEYKH